MKTKLISPWSIRPGMELYLETAPRDMSPTGNPRAFRVMEVSKGRGTFTGSTLWRVKYECPISSLGYSVISYHGKTNRLQAEKARVTVESINRLQAETMARIEATMSTGEGNAPELSENSRPLPTIS